MKIYMGIDPGFKGAVAIISNMYYEIYPVQVIDAPTLIIGKSKKEHSITEMVKIFDRFIGQEDIAIYDIAVAIEKVHSMPGQGVASAFTFGKGYGIWLGILATLGISYDEVTPQRWQKEMMDGMQRGKDAARIRAMQLFPQLADKLKLKSNDGRADALLIAEWRRRQG